MAEGWGTTTFMTFTLFYFRAHTRKTFFPFEGLMVWSVPLKRLASRLGGFDEEGLCVWC